jgi:DNA-binding response OmpR family regulator
MSDRRPSVLVVDDEPDFLVTYQRLLERDGLRVVTAPTVKAALEALRAQPPSLVITDLRLPDGDGIEVIRAARRGDTPTTVMAITGFPSEESYRAARAAGACTYLAKPFSARAFIALVRELVDDCPSGAPGG